MAVGGDGLHEEEAGTRELKHRDPGQGQKQVQMGWQTDCIARCHLHGGSCWGDSGGLVLRRTELLTHLLWGDLAILIEVQAFEQVDRRVLVPHKQVACGQPLLPGHQLHLKQQHRTAGDTPGWRRGREKRRRKASPSGPGLGPTCSLALGAPQPRGLSFPVPGAWNVCRTPGKDSCTPPASPQGQSAPHLRSLRVPGAGAPRAAASLPHTCPAGPCPGPQSPCWPPE